jgi:hypothetical protein
MNMTNYHASPHPRLVYAWEGQVEGLRAEIERLRAALVQVAGKNDLEGVPQDALPSAAYAALQACELIARDALEGVIQQNAKDS